MNTSARFAVIVAIDDRLRIERQGFRHACAFGRVTHRLTIELQPDCAAVGRRQRQTNLVGNVVTVSRLQCAVLEHLAISTLDEDSGYGRGAQNHAHVVTRIAISMSWWQWCSDDRCARLKS